MGGAQGVAAGGGYGGERGKTSKVLQWEEGGTYLYTDGHDGIK